MPCHLCAGAVVQFGIKSVIVGESVTFGGAVDFMLDNGISVKDMKDAECIAMMERYIKEHPEIWNEDIGS